MVQSSPRHGNVVIDGLNQGLCIPQQGFSNDGCRVLARAQHGAVLGLLHKRFYVHNPQRALLTPEVVRTREIGQNMGESAMLYIYWHSAKSQAPRGASLVALPGVEGHPLTEAFKVELRTQKASDDNTNFGPIKILLEFM